MSAEGSSDRPSGGLLVLLGVLAAFSPLSIDMYLPVLPAIGAELGATATAMQGTLSMFLFGLAGGQFVYGPLSDRLGRRSPLMAGIAIYVIATLGCALARSIEALVWLRLLQGLGGCAGVVISRAVIADRFRGAEAAQALSMLMLIMGVAPIAAPVAGAMLGSAFGWRAIFAVQVALALATGLCAWRFLPESRPQSVAEHARGENVFRACGTLLRNRNFAGYVLTAALCNASLLAYIATIPGLLVGHFKVPPAQVGWYFAVTSFVVIGANQLNRSLLRRYTSDHLLRVAVSFSPIPAALLVVVAMTGWGGLWSFMPLVLLASAPFAFVQSNANARGFAIEPLRAGSASALFGAGGYAAGALSGWAVSLAHDGTPIPVATGMLVCLSASALTYHLLARRRAAHTPAPVT